MELKLTFLGRAANRWRVRVEIPAGLRPRGLTVGLVGEDGRPLSKAVIVPDVPGRVFEAELSGPEELPHGTHVHAMVDVDGGVVEGSVGVHKRVGLHAYLMPESHLPVTDAPKGAALSKTELSRLSRAFPWMGRPEEDGAPGHAPEEDELLRMLKDEFDVDVEGMDEELVRMLKG